MSDMREAFHRLHPDSDPYDVAVWCMGVKWAREQDAKICVQCKKSYKFESKRLNVHNEHVRGMMEGMVVCEEAISNQNDNSE